MTFDEQSGYIMLGYEKAIVALSDLECESEIIQKLVRQIYQLQFDDVENNDDHYTRYLFSEKQEEMMLARKSQYIDIFGEEGFEYLLNAVTYFGYCF